MEAFGIEAATTGPNGLLQGIVLFAISAGIVTIGILIRRLFRRVERLEQPQPTSER
ncbi:MAG: hypothetical protein MUF87_16420 [Anaerolineae bacterium]|jgi:hypothetical protein|nr:hypothetical protein [Anaerolineae bacterium]